MSKQLEDIYNFLPLSDSIATAGQPTTQQFSDIKAAGYDVVINLALPTSTNAITNEQQIVENLGIKYVHIPVIWEKPTLEDIERFFAVMEENADKNVFVHCAMNMRVSAFVYLYRIIHEQTNIEEAKKSLYQIWQPNETWQQFIEKVIAYYQK
ncbi:protein tyrosine phosphatase family protein [Gloeocapsopsis sp. IPPAS B-1203]|uniref:protein tyrosine phosphatase family protein n=1 Tax=Gloeocapsopsis sp. IPPAS B-1203 TaxID=2049454 RepID=UPI000C19B8A1|nr:protein tyrosine phosphatase family protein [Gloeocapsopsis sp. IPPAS B-1203]PIG93857.1 phosphatase [Gloeocapsopsis sp. IPPAS B-1203]